jgi:hypothetical protein
MPATERMEALILEGAGEPLRGPKGPQPTPCVFDGRQEVLLVATPDASAWTYLALSRDWSGACTKAPPHRWGR